MNSDALINPICGKKSPKTGTVAIMAATLPDVHSFAGTLGFERNAYRDFFSSRIYEGMIGSSGFSLVGPFIGAPHAVMLLENLVVLGVRTVIFAGWCGSLSPDLETGDILQPVGAFSDEGTSRHYGVSGSDEPLDAHPELNHLVCDILNRTNIPYKTGTVWTTDAIYRETPEKINYFREKGAVAVEMELSALMAVARFRDIRLSSVLVVSDELGTMIWKPGFGDPRFKISRKRVSEILPTIIDELVKSRPMAMGLFP